MELERETRLELATPTLARLCSTTELFPLYQYRHIKAIIPKIRQTLVTATVERAPISDMPEDTKNSCWLRIPLLRCCAEVVVLRWLC